MKFSQILKELRNEKGIKQKELATKLMLTVSTISDWECERSQPNIQQLISISNYFKCSVDYLLGREDDFGIIHSANDGAKLRPDEERLLANFNNLIPPMQSYVLDMVEALTTQPQNKKKANL